MTALNIVSNTADGSTKAARAVDPYEFQYLVWNEESNSGELFQQFTDNPHEGMDWAGQLKFDDRVLAWDWICHYADGSSEYVMRSSWLGGNVPEDTRCQ